MRRALAALLLLAAVLLGVGTAPSAAAHAELVSSSPANGAELKRAPTEVRLVFSEPVRPVRKTFVLTDDAGDALSIVEPTGTSKTQVTKLPPKLGPGFYLLSFRVISVDNHPIKASIAFNVAAPAKAAATDHATHAAVVPPAPPADDSHALVTGLAGANRWLSYLGAIGLLGVAAFAALCWPGGATDRRTRRLVIGGALLVPLAALVALPLQSALVAGTGLGGAFSDGQLGDVVDARYGETMLLRVALALALFACLVLAARRPSRWALGLAAASGVGVLVTYARAGHPAAGDYPWLTVALDAVHLGAVAVWLGGLLVLAVRLLPAPTDDCPEVLRRWSTVATGAVAVLVVTGSIQAAVKLRSFSALVDTDYGRWIVAKSILLGGMLVLANLGRARVRSYATARPRLAAGASLGAKLADPAPAPQVRALRRSVAAELALAAAVLAATAVLTATSPPHDGHPGHSAAATAN
ncbi:MAG: copper resistance CopC/CopD family protein [Sporichthyaceae bacterium]